MALPAPPRQRRHEERFQQQHVAKQRRAERRRAARVAKALEEVWRQQLREQRMQSTATPTVGGDFTNTVYTFTATADTTATTF